MSTFTHIKWRHILALGAAVLVIVLLVFQQYLIPVFDIDDWRIEASNWPSATILWQKSIPCLRDGLPAPQGAVAISKEFVVINNNCIGLGASYVAFDRQTGAEHWRATADWQAGTSIQVTSDGEAFYSVVDDRTIIRLSPAGWVDWRSQKFTSRSVRYVFFADNTIIVPFRTSSALGIHLISSDTGEVIENVLGADIIAAFRNRILQWEEEDLVMIDRSVNQILFRAGSLAGYRDYTHIEISGNVLLVTLGKQQVLGYDIETGATLWRLDGDFVSVPTLVDDRLMIYDHQDRLRVFDVESGQLQGEIEFNRQMSGSDTTSNMREDVALVGLENTIAIAYRHLNELLVLSLE